MIDGRKQNAQMLDILREYFVDIHYFAHIIFTYIIFCRHGYGG